MKYKVCWVTLCKNEIDIIPFCADYWKRIADKVIVYDNGSIDGSIEELEKYPFVEVRHFDSNGQNEFIQKAVKEQAYLELKDSYDIIIITDMDEIFYFNDFEALAEEFIDGRYNVMSAPIYSLCEDSKPIYEEGKYLHQLCHKFYKQRMNHMKDFDDVAKLSIFNTRVTDKVEMSVGQHFVRTLPDMEILYEDNGFCLHIDKGMGIDYKWKVRQRMYNNLSKENKMFNMCIEYSDSYEKLKNDYLNNQKKSLDINKIFTF